MIQLKAAARALRKDAGFSTIAILTMGVAIAANTAMFSACDRLVFHPASIPDPSSLVAIWLTSATRHVQFPAMSVPRYDELAAFARSFSSLADSVPDGFTLTGDGEATQLNGLRISASFFPTLGIRPMLGRGFTAEEDVPNGPAVCILSHEAWQSLFGGREMLGRTIRLNNAAWQVVGIMPPRLTAPYGQVQVFAPRVFELTGLTAAQRQTATFARPIARLKPGVSLELARVELAAFSEQYRARHPGSLEADTVSEPRPFVNMLANGFKPTMYTLLGAGACVLLIACANVSALFLARLLTRRKEVAVRLSIGSTRMGIVRQFLVESLLFSSAAGAIGVPLALGSLRVLQSAAASQLPPNTVLALNWRTCLFMIGVTLACGVVTGLLPAIQASRPDLVEHLKDGMRGTSAGRGGFARHALIVAEVSLSVVLLVGAVLLIVTFVRLQGASPGFEPQGAAAAFVGLTPDRYATPVEQADFFDQVITNLHAQPGVAGAAVALATPLGGNAPLSVYGIAGQPVRPPSERPTVTIDVVSNDYFDLLHIPLAAGRGFTRDDRLTSPKVCVINETLARRVFPGKPAIGEALLFGRDGTTRIEIVGVIRDVKSLGVNMPTPDEVYFPFRQRSMAGLNVVAKTGGDPASLEGAITRAVAGVDKTQAISFFATLESNVAANLATARLVAALTMVFACLALMLAMIGLYSVLAYLVSQRTSEIGIRMALGASRRHVVSLVMRSGLQVVAIGLVLGVGGAAMVSRLIRQLLFGVDPLSVGVYAAVVLIFSGVAALACLGPSLRASRIDPLVALRTE